MLGLASTVSSSSTPESKYSLDFDGADDYVSLGASNSIMTTSQNEASLSVWIKATGAESDGKYIFQNQKTTGTTNFGLRINSISGKAEALIWNGSSHCNPSSTTDVTDGNWHHVVITGKASEQKIYVDGSVEDTHSEAFSMIPSVDDCTIGSINGASDFFNGKIDNVALWSVALDADAVEAIYNNGKPTNLTFDDGDNYDNSSALVAYYRMGNGSFDDKANGVVHDQHASGFGAELVTNGNFAADSDWNKEEGWSISGGVASFSGGTSNRHIKQDVGITSGKTYKIVYTVSSISAGEVAVRLGGMNGVSEITATSTGTYTGYIAANSSANGDVFIEDNDNNFVGSISSVSVKQLNGLPALTSGDIPFTSDAP